VRDSLDQIFIHAKQWLLSLMSGHAPIWLVQIASSFDQHRDAAFRFPQPLRAHVVARTKNSRAGMQNRYGPNSRRPVWLVSTIADGINVNQGRRRARARDKVVHFLAPIVIAAAAILALGVIPYGRNMTPFVIDGGILFFSSRWIDNRARSVHGGLGQQQ